MLDQARIAALLQPFAPDVSAELASQLQTYLALLLRWNARMNLTAVRDPEQIVTRHFGESLFAARVLCEAGAFAARAATLADVGSGAGFPGIPIKLLAPEVHLTLIESHNKKATFLREVIRTLGLDGAEVFCGRADSWPMRAGVVTLRAVENFQGIVPAAAQLVATGGLLCLLFSQAQYGDLVRLLGTGWLIADSVRIPDSRGRAVALARSPTI